MRCSFLAKPLDFGQFMDIVEATGADPYLVLNYKSANMCGECWGYEKLRDAAEAWVAYIVRHGYQARLSSLACLPGPHCVHYMQSIQASLGAELKLCLRRTACQSTHASVALLLASNLCSSCCAPSECVSDLQPSLMFRRGRSCKEVSWCAHERRACTFMQGNWEPAAPQW